MHGCKLNRDTRLLGEQRRGKQRRRDQEAKRRVSPDAVVQQVLANHAGQTLLHLVRLGASRSGFGLHRGRRHVSRRQTVCFCSGGVRQVGLAITFICGHGGGGGCVLKQQTDMLDSLRRSQSNNCRSSIFRKLLTFLSATSLSFLLFYSTSLFHSISSQPVSL